MPGRDGGGRKDSPPGEAGATPSAQDATGTALVEAGRVIAACLPSHMQALDASGARVVAGLLGERLAAGWRPAEIRSLMDQELPPVVHRLSALVAARLRANVDPALAPGRPDSRRVEAERQRVSRRRSEELAGTSRARDAVREAAEAEAWERARREAPPGASRLDLARRVAGLVGADDPGAGRAGRDQGRGRTGRGRGAGGSTGAAS